MIYGFIPVRAGSKGIPHKNVKPFLGKPLVLWIVDAMSASLVDEIIVATDDHDVMDYLHDHDKVTIWSDEDAAAADMRVNTENVMLQWVAARRPAPRDMIILAQATSPYTRWDDINAIITGMSTGGKGSMISVYPIHRFFWQPSGKPMNYALDARPRRQDAPPYYMENGALYATSVGDLQRTRCRVSGNIGLHIMRYGFELDDPEDWVIGETTMREVK